MYWQVKELVSRSQVRETIGQTNVTCDSKEVTLSIHEIWRTVPLCHDEILFINLKLILTEVAYVVIETMFFFTDDFIKYAVCFLSNVIMS